MRIFSRPSSLPSVTKSYRFLAVLLFSSAVLLSCFNVFLNAEAFNINRNVAVRRSSCFVLGVPTRSTGSSFAPAAGRLTTTPNKNRLQKPFYSQKQTDGDITVRPDPSMLLASQSATIQKIGVASIAVVLGVGTVGFVNLLATLENSSFYELWRDYTWAPGFGLIYIAAGIAHFTSKQAFANIVPPYGTWGGLWAVPAPGAKQLGLSYEDYHTYWTGIAEIGGGLLLILSMVTDLVPVQVPSFLLFLLTIAVTPANIYMFTHDAEMGNDIPTIPYPWGHVGRGVMQMIILAMLFKLAFQE